MSADTIERVLWEFGEYPEKVKAFKEDPDGYLANYPLSQEEFRMVRHMDVEALAAYGISSMLGMLGWTMVMGNNPIVMFDYLTRINHGKLPNHFKLPTPVFHIMRLLIVVHRGWVGLMKTLGLRKI